MESVSHVTPERSHLYAFFEVNEANVAIGDAPEPSLVILYLGGVLDDGVASFLLLAALTPVRVARIKDAWRHDDEHSYSAHDQESLWKHEANEDDEHDQAKAWVRVVAVRRKAFKCAKDDDHPGSVKESRE